MSARSEAPLVLGVALTCALFTFPVILVMLASGPLFYYHVLALLADIPLAIAVAAVAARAIAERRRPNTPAVLALGLLAALSLAFAVHPSAQGAQLIVRAAAAIALAVGIVWLRGRETWPLVIAALGATAIAQAALAVAQVLHRGPLGIPSLGEFADPLQPFGAEVAPRGTMYQQYLLAALGLLAALLLVSEGLRRARPAPWLAAAGIAIVPVGLTYSRSALAGLAVACLGLAVAGRARPRRHALAVAALLIGTGIPALLTFDGWTSRAGSAIDPSGRDVEYREGLDLYATSPVIGIGPGRMVIALGEHGIAGPDRFGYQPVHGVPLLLTVEAGPLAGALTVALLAAVAWRARRSPIALAIFAVYLPFVLLDHFPYTHAQGLVLSGIWLGAVIALAREPGG
jgi:hypothetical protein